MNNVTAAVVFGMGLWGLVLSQQSDSAVKAEQPATPIIVANKSFVNQTAPLPDTTLFTPAADGDYRVSLYVSAPPTSPRDSVVEVSLSWTDDFQSISRGTGAEATAGSHFVDFKTVMLRVKAGKPISVSVDQGCCGVPFAFPYSLYVTVEHLPGQADDSDEGDPGHNSD